MIAAELFKLRSTMAGKVVFLFGMLGMLLVAVLQIVLSSIIATVSENAALTETMGSDFGAELTRDLGNGFDSGSVEFQRSFFDLLGSTSPTALASCGVGALAALVIGILIATTDFRHGGIVPTALAIPSRGRIVQAKAVVAVVVALCLGLAYAAISGIVMAAVVVFTDLNFVLPFPTLAVVVSQGLIVLVLLTLLGLGLGLMVRSQLVSFLILGSFLLFEPMIQGLIALICGEIPVWAQFLPLTLGQLGTGSFDAEVAMSPIVALVGLAVWSSVSLGFGALRMCRQDLD